MADLQGAKRLAWLAFGRVGSRIASAGVQLGAAVFLAPEALGAWAAASSLAAPVASLKNLGAANAALRSDAPPRAWRQTLRRPNQFVVLGVALLGFLSFSTGVATPQEALLIAASSLLPYLAGSAELDEVRLMRQSLDSAVMRSYWAAAGAQLTVGLVAAWLLNSPWALYLAAVASGATLAASMRQSGARSEVTGRAIELGPLRFRAPALVLGATLASKADYLVGVLTLSRAELGLYFLAYQTSVGISSLAAVPLGRVFILSGAASGANLAQLRRASRYLLLMGLPICAVGGYFAGRVIPLIAGEAWSSPFVFLAVFLSVPFRLIGLLVTSSDQRAGDWLKPAIESWIDAAGTALAALIGSTVFGSILAFACSVAVWKSVFALYRYWMRCRGWVMHEPRDGRTVAVRDANLDREQG